MSVFIALEPSLALSRTDGNGGTRSFPLDYYVIRSRLSTAGAGGSMDKSQLLKGVLDLAVLAVLAQEEGYGYDVVRRLRGAGLDEVGDASVYGTLRRLFQQGRLTSYVVPSEEGPHRKYYGLNRSGRDFLAQATKQWDAFTEAMDALLKAKEAAA